jgi:hypothetical protein
MAMINYFRFYKFLQFLYNYTYRQIFNKEITKQHKHLLIFDHRNIMSEDSNNNKNKAEVNIEILQKNFYRVYFIDSVFLFGCDLIKYNMSLNNKILKKFISFYRSWRMFLIEHKTLAMGHKEKDCILEAADKFF